MASSAMMMAFRRLFVGQPGVSRPFTLAVQPHGRFLEVVVCQRLRLPAQAADGQRRSKAAVNSASASGGT
jgi:hypothetical protein